MEIKQEEMEKLKKLTVLLVEDEKMAAEGYIRMLSRRFATVLYGANGLEALKVLDDNHVDIIITDLEMPEMGGAEMIEIIRSKSIKLPIIVVTAFEDEADKIKNVDAVLTKPVDRDTLFEKLVECACR